MEEVNLAFNLAIAVFGAGISIALAAFAYWRAVEVVKTTRRAEFVQEAMVEAYLALERNSSNNFDEFPPYRDYEIEWQLEVERAIAKLQLFGPTPLAEQIANNIQEGRGFSPDASTLKGIRDELRASLGLSLVNPAPMSLRAQLCTTKNGGIKC